MGSKVPPIPVEGKNWTVRLLMMAALLAGTTLLVLIIIFSLWRWHLRKDIETKEAAIKSAGQPLNWDDLARWPAEIPDDENAAFTYTNAIAHLCIRSIPIDENFREYLGPLSAKTNALLEATVRTNFAALQIISQVADASKSRYPIDYQDGPSAKLPHLAGLRQLAVVLGYDAILKAEASDTAASVKDVQSSLKLSESLDDEPFLISQLVSAAMLDLSSSSLEGVLRRTPLTEEQLSQLESQFSQVEATNRFLTGLIGERAMYNELICLAQDDPAY